MRKKIEVANIDTGIPVPDRASYPIRDLAVGESFVFPLNKRGSVQTKASKIKAETGHDYTIRKIDNDTARIWRTN